MRLVPTITGPPASTARGSYRLAFPTRELRYLMISYADFRVLTFLIPVHKQILCHEEFLRVGLNLKDAKDLLNLSSVFIFKEG